MQRKNFLSSWYPFLWLALVALLVYFRVICYGYSFFDDNVLILNNQAFLRDIYSLSSAFSQDVFRVLNGSAAYYRPLYMVSFMFDSWIGGDKAAIYHLTNLAYHIIASGLVFILLQRFKVKKPLALAMSCLFAAHPALASAVAWIPGRNDILLTIFGLAAWIYLIDFLSGSQDTAYFWHLLFLGLALLTKETALVMIPMAYLYIWLVKKERFNSFNQQILLVGYLPLLAIWFWLRHNALAANPLPLNPLEMARAIFHNLPALIQMLGKLIIPLHLSVLPIIQDTPFIYGIISLLLLGICLVVSPKTNWRLVSFGVLWFVLFLLPNFYRPTPSGIADFIEHRLYLPAFGLALVVAQIHWSRRFANLLFISFFLAFVGLNWWRLPVFKDRIAFWQNASQTSPHNPLAWRNLGAMYYLDHKLDAAIPLYKQALALNPNEPMAHNNLGLVYMDKGMNGEAEAQFKEEIVVNPGYDDAHYNLGLLYWKLGRKDEAVSQWQITVQLNPYHTGAVNNLKAISQANQGN